MIYNGDKYLITSDQWFFAPDGKQYKSAWGSCEVLGDDILGIKTNLRSTNWYVKVGSKDKHVIMAGCQIHYAVKCEEIPYTGNYIAEERHEDKQVTTLENSRIYIAE